MPGQVVVSVSGNNQQFINDKTIHFRDVENTFEYYQELFIQQITPQYISNSGNSSVILKGMLFDQFRNDNNTERHQQLYCRYVDVSSGNVIGKPINMTRISYNEQECVAPKNDLTGDAKIQYSVNGQQWHDTGDHGLKFYNGPRVTSVNPSFGVTKNPRNQKMEIQGENFVCPNSDCSKLKVKFTNFEGREILEDGQMTETGSIVCDIPKYPAPETLDVDVSFNDQDFTNNGVKFGYLDPFIEDVEPKLVSTKGTTKLKLMGYGFVKIDDSKDQVALKSDSEELKCNGVTCTKSYKVIDERTAEVGTFEQSVLLKDSQPIGFQPFTVNMMDPDGGYAENDIKIRYYKDPEFKNISSQFAYSNEDKPIIIDSDFYWGQGNDLVEFMKFSNITCRFTSQSDSSKQILSPAIMEYSPIGSFNKESKPD